MDSILVAQRLPKLAERAMREAIVSLSLSPRGMRPPNQQTLANDALVRFERMIRRAAYGGVRPALLFAERDRIVGQLQVFVAGRLASRLFALRHRDVVAVGRDAGVFDAIVRGRRGGIYGVVFRRLARDGRRLEAMRTIRSAANAYRGEGLRGVLVYDFVAGSVRTLRCGATAVELTAA
ncbi:MAG: hypothetical protein WB615_15510 [Candidatus Tumulicola sp.]